MPTDETRGIDVACIYDDTLLQVPLPVEESVFFHAVMRRHATREIVQDPRRGEPDQLSPPKSFPGTPAVRSRHVILSLADRPWDGQQVLQSFLGGDPDRPRPRHPLMDRFAGQLTGFGRGRRRWRSQRR